MQAAVASVGARLLAEIDEASLDEILASLRTGFATTTPGRNYAGEDSHTNNAVPTRSSSNRLKHFPIPGLNDLVQRHFRATQSAPLAITGRYRELLYVLVATLITSPHDKAVAIVDFDGRFDPERLLATAPAGEFPHVRPAVEPGDLDHVHILRATRGGVAHIANCLASMEQYMLYRPHRSRAREWWGTVVIGGGLNPASTAAAAASAQMAVTADWKGWLRVDRAETQSFGDMPVDEALADRDERQNAVDDAGWVATSPWGAFSFGTRGRP
ncbi:hypothetical protein B0T26DRAFT_736090 [Lasiosphaeria miniovina]|uniref:Uncharacterized protein n=1 Tax=Lasiosphaeria miniovina TaxID=1954250 RepID=A0AA40BF03_9PEZI|nr:uncharacterized protein B0T26DRAFT_736090 [Lasiosphaeria miniovina]KAK0732984.1 hypothetical protein B0T26DRAFT_736090 [Lasiosphaeria miniovina]